MVTLTVGQLTEMIFIAVIFELIAIICGLLTCMVIDVDSWFEFFIAGNIEVTILALICIVVYKHWDDKLW